MVGVVLDSSAVLAHLWNEPGGDFEESMFDTAQMSTVNIAEVISRLIDRGAGMDVAETIAKGLAVNAVAFDFSMALEAGKLRAETRHRGLSLGDRACLALARQNGATVLTADRAWADLDIDLEIEMIR